LDFNFVAVNEVIYEYFDTTTCSKICLAIFKVAFVTPYGKGDIRFEVGFLKTKGYGLYKQFGSVNIGMVFLKAIYIPLNDRVHVRLKNMFCRIGL
jgi:hypothetical protein